MTPPTPSFAGLQRPLIAGTLALLASGALLFWSQAERDDAEATQSERIRANKQPDGSAMTPRKPQPKLRGRKGATRRRMFTKLVKPAWLKATATASEATVAFTGSANRLATVHHFGLRDKIRGKTVQYPERQLIGITDAAAARCSDSHASRTGPAASATPSPIWPASKASARSAFTAPPAATKTASPDGSNTTRPPTISDRLTTFGPGMICATAQSSRNSSCVSQRLRSTISRWITASTPPNPCKASQVNEKNRSASNSA